eukprot:SAG31_NODE_205_length_20397_cov_19.191152_4_plen_1565_part_00
MAEAVADGDPPPHGHGGPDSTAVPWRVAVAFLSADPGDGTIETPSDERLVALAAMPNITLVYRNQDRPVTGSENNSGGSDEGNGTHQQPATVPIGDALASFQQQILYDTEAGKQAKFESSTTDGDSAAKTVVQLESQDEQQANTEVESEATEPAAESEAEVEPESEPFEMPDIVYVLLDFMQSESDVEAVLASEIPIDAVINLRLPPEIVTITPPTEEEIQLVINRCKVYCSAVLAPLLTGLNAPVEDAAEPRYHDADDFYEKLELFLKGLVQQLPEDLIALHTALPEEVVSAYDGRCYDGAKLAEAIYNLIPVDEDEDLVVGSGKDVAEQIDAIFTNLAGQSESGLDAFVMVSEAQPEPEAVEAVATRHMKAYLNEMLAPDSYRHGIAWTLQVLQYEDDSQVELVVEAAVDTEAAPFLDEDAAAAVKNQNLAQNIAATVFEFVIEKDKSRQGYLSYTETLDITDISVALDAPDLTYYHKILDAYESEGSVSVLHVVYCLVEQLAEEAKTADGEPNMESIEAFLADAMQGVGAPALDKLDSKGTKELVESNMTDLLPLPGRKRAGMPQSQCTDSERLAETCSLYPFVCLHKNQVERALLRDSVRQMILDYEIEVTPQQLATLPAVWDAHLSSRVHFEHFDSASMAAAYQSAVSVLSPVTKILKAYDSRHDRMLVALHTPTPSATRIGVPVTERVTIPAVPNLAKWEDGVAPPHAYRVPYQKSEVACTHQTVFPLDSGCLVCSVSSTGKRRLTAYVSDNIFGTESTSGLYTSTLADGTVIVVEAGQPFCTVTLTDTKGLSVRLHGSGRVDIMRANALEGKTRNDHNGMAKDIWTSVVSKGSLVRKYDDDSIHIAYRTGDTSAYTAADRSWIDTNESGGRQKRPMAGGKINMLSPLRTERYIDHETNAEVIARQDRVKKNYHVDGSVQVEHADGTTMTTMPGCTFVSIPDFDMTVTVASSHTEVVLSDGGTMRLTWPVLNRSWLKDEMHGPGSLKPTQVLKQWPLDAKSTILVTQPDGSTTTIRDNVVTAAPSFPGGSEYTFDLNNSTAKASDRSSTEYTFGVDGSAVCAQKRGESRSPERLPKIESHQPRVFVVNPDGSGMEWCPEDRIGYWLSKCTEAGLLLSQCVPEEPRSTTFTADGINRAIVRHPQLTDSELSAMENGLAQFAEWTATENGEADALVTVERRSHDEIIRETAVQKKAHVEEVDQALCKAMIDKYNASDEVLANADEYYRKFDLDSDGTLTADEMRTQLAEWGVSQPLEDYISTDSAGEILADKIITKGEWYSFFFPVIEMLPPSPALTQAEADAEAQAVANDYGASATLIASADEFYRRFDLNNDGVLTAEEMRSQLDAWGIVQPLEDYISTEETAEILADRIISKAEWYSFYFPVIEMLQPLRTRTQKAAIPAQKPDSEIQAREDNQLDSQQFLVYPQKLDFGRLIEGCAYRQPFSMTNVSNRECKFRVRLPQNQSIRVITATASGAAVAAKATCMMEVEINANEVGTLHEPIEIIADDSMVFRLEVSASIKFPPKVNFYPYGTGKRVPVQHAAVGKVAANLRAQMAVAE